MSTHAQARDRSLTTVVRCIGGGWLTCFYSLWILRHAAGWSLWLGCPKSKVVRLVRLFRREHETAGTSAIIIPLRDWRARHPHVPRRHADP